MNTKQAKQIFEKYNPIDAVTCCPNEKTAIRESLNTYAKAAVNLYGIISVKEFVEIFNSQNAKKTNTSEVFNLLLPIILKNRKLPIWRLSGYCFYKDCIVHYIAFRNFIFGDFLLNIQGDKPRFIPEKTEFLKYENKFYEDENQQSHWEKVIVFICKEWPNKNGIFSFWEELKENSQRFVLMRHSELLEEYNLIFRSKKKIQPFFDLLETAHNNTRLWINKGYSPIELMKIKKRDLSEWKNNADKACLEILNYDNQIINEYFLNLERKDQEVRKIRKKV